MIKIVDGAQRGRVAIIDTGTTPKTTTTPLDDATKAARDRIVGNGWDIEDELTQDLMDPLIRELKDQSHWSDVVFLSAAGARETISGAIATIPDWSGAENDAIQATAADRPTLDTNGISGRCAADFDGAGDALEVPTSPLTLTKPFTVVSLWTTQLTGNVISWSFENASDDNYIGVGTNFRDVKLYSSGETPGAGSTLSENTAYIVSIEWDGTDFSVYLDGTFDYKVSPSSTNWQTATDEFNIGLSKSNSLFWDGYIISILGIQATGVRDEVEDIYTNYYSL